MVSLILGLVFSAAGLFGIIRWWEPFLEFIAGFLPLSMFLIGIIAITAGISSIIENVSSNRDNLKK